MQPTGRAEAPASRSSSHPGAQGPLSPSVFGNKDSAAHPSGLGHHGFKTAAPPAPTPPGSQPAPSHHQEPQRPQPPSIHLLSSPSVTRTCPPTLPGCHHSLPPWPHHRATVHGLPRGLSALLTTLIPRTSTTTAPPLPSSVFLLFLSCHSLSWQNPDPAPSYGAHIVSHQARPTNL